MGALGDYYHNQYDDGNRDVIAALAAEEANLLHARRLARAHGWHDALTSTMQGLRTLYGHTGRRAEWKRLVEEIVPDFVDPATDGPLPGREKDWGLLTEYRVRLAQEARDWSEAERLQRLRVDWDRRRAAPLLDQPAEAFDPPGRNTVRTLGVSLHDLAQIQRERGEAECATHYRESLEIDELLGDQPGAAVTAFNLGRAYTEVPVLRDLDQAETWYRRGLDLRDEVDRLGRARCLGQLGCVARERFKEALAAEAREDELLRLINEAAGFYHQALDLLPEDAVNDRAVTENQLGAIYADAGDLDRALPHYRECIRLDESAGNPFGAAQTRFNVAVCLARAGRFADARAALRNYETFGRRAAAEIEKTKGLLAAIDQAERQGPQGA